MPILLVLSSYLRSSIGDGGSLQLASNDVSVIEFEKPGYLIEYMKPLTVEEAVLYTLSNGTHAGWRHLVVIDPRVETGETLLVSMDRLKHLERDKFEELLDLMMEASQIMNDTG